MAYAGDPTGTNLTSGEATEINNSSPIDQKYKLGQRTRNLRGDLDAVGTISSTSLTLNPENGASGTVIVPGNLTVNGATTTVSTTNTVIEDKLVEIATGTSGTPSGDAGLVVERGSSTNAAFVWDESADSWVAATTSATGASTGDLTLTPTDLNVSDIALTPDGISTSHIISSGSLTIRTDANMIIGDSTVDSIKIGRTNTTACRVHLRSGGADDLVVTGGKVGIGTNSPAVDLEVLDTTASSASQGGNLRLTSNDGAAMASGHRLGALEFAGAEDASSTIVVGARIEALCDAGWSATENGTDLLFYTNDGNDAQAEQMRILANGNVGIGVADPDAGLEVLAGSGSQLKLSFDGTDNATFAVDTAGDLTIVPSGSDVIVTGKLNVSAGIEVTTAGTATITETGGGAKTAGNAGTMNVRKGVISVDVATNSCNIANSSVYAITVTNSESDADSVIVASTTSPHLTCAVLGQSDSGFVIGCSNTSGGAEDANFTVNFIVL